MTEQPLDLRYTLRAFRRSWRVVVALFAVGVACGGLLAVLRGPTFEAPASVLFPPSAVDATGRPLRNMMTERRIARSAAVLRPAGEALEPPVAASRLVKRVKVSAVGLDILEIRAQARSAREAVTLANAVAKEYVNFSNSATADRMNTSITVLQDQAAALQNQIAKLDGDIAAGSTRLGTLPTDSLEAAQQAALIDSQRAAQVDAARQLSTLNSRIADDRLNAELTRRGLRVLEPATTPSESSRREALLITGTGGAGGVLGGAMLAIYLGHRNRRLRSRDEVAGAVGVPVLASVAVRRPKRVGEWRELLERWRPSASEALALRQMLTSMRQPDTQQSTDITVVTLPGDTAALALAVELAGFSADSGVATRLVVTIRDRSANHLRSACAVASKSGAEVRPNLWVLDRTDGIEATDVMTGDLTVRVAAADGDALSVPSLSVRTSAVLAVSSGFATSDVLAANLLACQDRRQPVAGVLLANPEPDDHTLGLARVANSMILGDAVGVPSTVGLGDAGKVGCDAAAQTSTSNSGDAGNGTADLMATSGNSVAPAATTSGAGANSAIRGDALGLSGTAYSGPSGGTDDAGPDPHADTSSQLRALNSPVTPLVAETSSDGDTTARPVSPVPATSIDDSGRPAGVVAAVPDGGGPPGDIGGAATQDCSAARRPSAATDESTGGPGGASTVNVTPIVKALTRAAADTTASVPSDEGWSPSGTTNTDDAEFTGTARAGAISEEPEASPGPGNGSDTDDAAFTGTARAGAISEEPEASPGPGNGSDTDDARR